MRPASRSFWRCILTSIVLLSPMAAHPADNPLHWEQANGFRFAELSVPTAGRAGFTSVPAHVSGIRFTNELSLERGLTNQIFLSGSGLAAGDVDGDGRCDLYFCSLEGPNRLYLNRGNWIFDDSTDKSGVACNEGASTGAVLVDIEGDGDLDLLVSGLGRGVRLFLNDGTGRFQERTDTTGLRGQSAAMSMALADIDGDGDLDLYVANYRTATFQDEPAIPFRIAITNGVRRISAIRGRAPTPLELQRFSVSSSGSGIVENGEPDILYRNEGTGRFSTVSWTEGTFLDAEGYRLSEPPLDWGYAAMFRDLNGDRSPDLYVCNDSDSPDRCWINDGRGRFRAMDTRALRQTSFSSMGVDFADLDRDGFDEFFVADMLGRERRVRHRLMTDRHSLAAPGVFDDRPASPRNTLFLNRGDGTYAEIAQMAGVDATDWTWGPIFLDVDLDGYEDLLLPTGLERSLRDLDARQRLDRERAQRGLSARAFQELRRDIPRLDTPNHAFRNRGDLTFEEVSAAWGFDSPQCSQGMALADLDGDGDQDVVINVLNGAALVYRNEATAPRLAVRLRAPGPNTHGIGARLRVTGGPVSQSQEMIAGGRYLSGDDVLRTFASGNISNRMTIEVTWRDGKRTEVRDARPNRIYEIEHSSPPANEAKMVPMTPARWFENVSQRLNHRHHESAFNDFERQALLPRKFSQAGPAAAWADLNQDGYDDLLVGSGRGGSLGVFLNDGQGGFYRIDAWENIGPLSDDSGGIVAAPSPTGTSPFVAFSNYESGDTNSASVRSLSVGRAGLKLLAALPGELTSSGPLALADLTGNGALALFVGGTIIPGRYPEAARSRLYRLNVDGRPEAELRPPLFEHSGLVNGAAFSDLNGDGLPELLLACDWSPIRVFRNQHGQLEPWDPPVHLATGETVALSRLTGWWNSITTGDFDGDGRLDVVAGNWGRNTKFQSHLQQPLRIHYGDLRGDGRVEVIESFFDRSANRYAPSRPWDSLALAIPSIRERISTATTYSEASLETILGPASATLREWTAATLDSMIFLNRGDHWEGAPLQPEAQRAPVFGVVVADWNGDGNEDLFLACNFFAVDDETSRYDAGRGLVLRGDGRGRFDPLPAAWSGIDVAGEQRAAAAADFDGDGRVDLVVTQNGAATRLFRNAQAKPGLRVRLDAGPSNRQGIGAIVRAASPSGLGPAKAVRAGSGYWSQDSAVLVLARLEPLASIIVQWPGGRKTTNEIPTIAAEVLIESSGTMKKLR